MIVLVQRRCSSKCDSTLALHIRSKADLHWCKRAVDLHGSTAAASHLGPQAKRAVRVA